MRSDWDPEPTVEGVIVYAESSPIMGDVIHVRGDDVADEIFNLLRRPSRERPSRAPFVISGVCGALARHGVDARQVLGRQCHIYASPKLTAVSIANVDGEMGDTRIWHKYV